MRSIKDPPAKVKLGRYVLHEIRENGRLEFSHKELMKVSGLGVAKSMRKVFWNDLKGMFRSENKTFKVQLESYEGGLPEFLDHLSAIVEAMNVGPEKVVTSKLDFETAPRIRSARFINRGRRL